MPIGKLGISIESISIDINLQNNIDTKWRFKYDTNQIESENTWYQFWNSKTILKDRYKLIVNSRNFSSFLKHQQN